MYRIATNKLIDWFRSGSYNHKKRTIPLEDIYPVDDYDITIQYEHKEVLEQIGENVGSFPADIQIIFRLNAFGTYTLSEIASHYSSHL